jgi:serine/threonine-protein kinase
VHTTDQGQVKGKLRYMAPEQISRERPLGRTVDIYSTGVVLWELLSGRRLFDAESDVGVVGQVLLGSFARPSDVARERGLRTPEERAIVDRIEPVLTRALATEPAARFASAREMARALEGLVPRAPLADVAGWVDHVAGEALRARAALVASLERGGQALASLASADEPTAVGADAATTNPPSRPLMRRPLVIVGAVLAATVVLGLLVARAREGNARVDPRAAPAAIKADPPAPSAATASTAATASSSAPPIVRDAPPKAPAVPATPHRTDACKPPYTWDAQGVKHFKPECM